MPGVIVRRVAWFLPPWPWRRIGAAWISRLALVLIPILMVQSTVILVRAKNADPTTMFPTSWISSLPSSWQPSGA